MSAPYETRRERRTRILQNVGIVIALVLAAIDTGLLLVGVNILTH